MQVGRATVQMQEWMVREQRGQLLQQVRQLQEEADRFGSKGGVGGDGGEDAQRVSIMHGGHSASRLILCTSLFYNE